MIDQLFQDQAYRPRRRAGRSRPPRRRGRGRRGCRAWPFDGRHRAARQGRGHGRPPKATTSRCASSSASGWPASRPPPPPTRTGLPSAPSPWPRSRRKIPCRAWPIGTTLSTAIRDLDLFDATEVSGRAAERGCACRRGGGAGGQGRHQFGGSGASAGMGGLVLATSHGFLGHYIGLPLFALRQRHRRRGHRHGARLRLLVAPPFRRPRRA